MNFSLYKADYKKYYKKYLVLSLLFVSLIIGFSRCVAIEDLLPPTISNFTLEEQYNVTETILLNANLFDNFVIKQATITIKRTEGPSSLDTTLIIGGDSTAARSLNLINYPIYIPADAALGEYKFTLTVTDGITNDKRKANVTTISKSFMVSGDALDPDPSGIVLNLNLDINPTINLSITKLSDSTYQACRSSSIPISGIASDNVGLSSISARFQGATDSIFFNLRGRLAVGLDTLFRGIDAIKIPSTALNGTTINLVFRLKDNVGNQGIAIIPFKVNCDDQSPIIERIDTNIKSNITQSGDSINIIQGQELFINGGEIRDRLGALDRLIIYLEDRTEGEAVNDTLFSEQIGGESYTIRDDIPVFSFRSTPKKGKVFYSLKVKAIDTVGNVSDIREIKLFITENEFPSVTPTIIEVNRISTSNIQPFNINNPIAVSTGSNIRLYGKISDDLELAEYRITWGIIDREIVILEGNSNNFTFDNETIGIINVSENARIETIYTLTIYAKDILDKENSETYYFKVQ